jgi:GABA(A) receptor-associated protein
MAYFRDKYTFNERLTESIKIKDKFPGRVPVIVERAPRSDAPLIDKIKYLVPGDLTVGQFMFVIRKRLSLSSEKALFIYVNNTLPLTNTLMRELYHHSKEPDGFMYVLYTGENTFGSMVR